MMRKSKTNFYQVDQVDWESELPHPVYDLESLKKRASYYIHTKRLPKQRGRTCLPKFKFSAKFSVGLHVILQIQIKKKSKMPNILCEKIFKRKSVELLEVILNEFCL